MVLSMQLQPGSSGISRIRTWIHLADFGSKNMDGWSHPPEELEKSFPRTGAEVWDWHIFGEKHLKEYPSVLTA